MLTFQHACFSWESERCDSATIAVFAGMKLDYLFLHLFGNLVAPKQPCVCRAPERRSCGCAIVGLHEIAPFTSNKKL